MEAHVLKFRGIMFVLLCSCLCTLSLGLWVLGCANAWIGDDFGSLIGFGVVFGIIFCASWLMGIYSKVLVSESGICVINPMVKSVVPWEAVESIGSRGGKGFTVETKGGGKIESIQFGASLVGEIFGYRSHLNLIRASRERLSRSHGRSGGSGEVNDVVAKINAPILAIAMILSAFQVPTLAFLFSVLL